MKRRDFLTGMCGIGSVMATAELPTWADEEDFFPNRGQYERLVLNYVHLRIGLSKPFSVLHISDTHLAEAYSDEPKVKLEQRIIGCGASVADRKRRCAIHSLGRRITRTMSFIRAI